MASSLYRAVGAIGRNMIVANTFGYFLLVLVFVLSGFVLSHDNLRKWWVWGYWTSPMMYTGNAILVNEFTSHSWSRPSSNPEVSLGVAVLRSLGFFTKDYWYWIGIGALLGMLLVCNAIFISALTFLNPLGKPQAVIPESSTSNTDQNGVLVEERGKKMKDQGATENRLVLLKNVSGAFRPGVLTALMGVSGAGKTTLMDVLAGRKTGGYIEGDIRISGYPKKHETFARISGYCEQNDIHSPYVTVHKSLLFSAWLRLPLEIDPSTRKTFVENVMELVELISVKDGLVGLPGVSGLLTEQRKRLTIAVELVANPSIIFMDEPTSGLDARAAAIVMRTVRNTANTGRTVVCTIHQPSIDIFEAFDELFLMKRGGEEIYVGPLGRDSCHLIQYFEGIQGVPKIRDGYNPATWMLEVTSSAQETNLMVNFAEIYRNSELYRRNKALIHELSVPRPGSSDIHFQTQYSQSFAVQCMACLWKQHCSYWRNPPHTAIRILFTTFLAILFGSIFWDLGSKKGTQQDIFNAMGSMYASVFFLGSHTATSVQPVVAVERTVLYRERVAQVYSAMPYAFGQAVIEIPYVFAQAMIFGTITYSMIGFEWTAAKYLLYMYFFFVTLLYFTFYGMMIAAMTPDINIAHIISIAFYTTWNIFSGFIIPRPSTPIWMRWCHWANPVAWSLYGLVASQFGDDKNQLDTNQTVEEFLRSYFGFKHDFVGVVAAVLVGIVVLFGLIFAFAIKEFNFQRR